MRPSAYAEKGTLKALSATLPEPCGQAPEQQLNPKDHTKKTLTKQEAAGIFGLSGKKWYRVG
jgi:hypothetical protein